jgi:cation diffusion facilitator CzcD-associated flavoprotein CzcO
MFPNRSEFTAYLQSYADQFQLPIRTGVEATGLERDDGGWLIDTTRDRYGARIIVVATGIMSSPVLLAFPGMKVYTGPLFHSTEYRRPDERLGKSILVIGIGNSAAEISSELANTGRQVTLSVRSGATVIPRSIAGIPSQYYGWAMSWLPGPFQRGLVRFTSRLGGLLKRREVILPRKSDAPRCQDVPVVGHAILDHLNAGRVRIRPGVAEFTAESVRFIDGTEWQGDTLVMATGYRSAMEWMGKYGARDHCNFALRQGRIKSADHPDLYFVGHNYDGRGGLYNIRIDAKNIARQIARSLDQVKVGEGP